MNKLDELKLRIAERRQDAEFMERLRSLLDENREILDRLAAS